jgi:hypothetical protein
MEKMSAFLNLKRHYVHAELVRDKGLTTITRTIQEKETGRGMSQI